MESKALAIYSTCRIDISTCVRVDFFNTFNTTRLALDADQNGRSRVTFRGFGGPVKRPEVLERVLSHRRRNRHHLHRARVHTGSQYNTVSGRGNGRGRGRRGKGSRTGVSRAIFVSSASLPDRR